MARSTKPLHQQLVDDLRDKIRSGFYSPGEQLPTEVDLAARLELSRGTVRQALQSLVAEGFIERIAGKGSFIKKPGLSVPLPPRSRLVGMVVPSLRDQLSTDMINGAERILRDFGYSLVFCHSDHEMEVEKAQLLQLLTQQVSGIILFPLAFPQETGIVRGILNQGIPVVAIDRHILDVPVPTIQVDNFAGAYSAVRHLLDLGHRRIACVSNSSAITSVLERVRGYEQAMRDANLLPYAAVPLLGPSTMLADATPLDIGPDEFRLVEHMLHVEDRPSAIFCINDFAAIGIMRHLLASGIRIPADMAVAGFDNSPFAPYAPVPLTSVAQPAVEIGAKAAEAVLAAIRGETDMPEVFCLPTRLVIRESTTGVP